MKHIAGDSNSQLGVLIARWYAEQVGKPVYAPYGAIGFLDKDNNIQGAAILEGYNGANVNLHIYGPRCVTKYNLKVVLNYVFNVLKCNRLTSITRRSNKKWLRVLPRLRFEYETTLIGYFGSQRYQDGVVYKMTHKEASSWIKING